MTDYIGQFTASAEQQFADAIRDCIHLMRITGFRTESGLDPLSGQRYCAWVRTWAGVRSVLAVTVSDQETMAYRMRAEGAPADLLVIDSRRVLWRTAGPFLRCAKELLAELAGEPGHFTAARSAPVDQPPHL
jgi:hypothetical protein